MKEIIALIATWFFCTLGIFFSLAVVCYSINPENITRLSMGVWAAAGAIDAFYLITWKG